MATPTNTPVIKQIRTTDNTLHDIAALYLTDGTNYYSPEDLLSAGVDYNVASTLPTAGATYKGKIYLIPDSSDVEGGSYIEYICVNTSGSNYSWEPIGTTKINVQVSNVSAETPVYSVTYDKADSPTGSAGGATVNGSNFTFSGITGTVSVPAHSHTLGGTKKYLTKENNIPKTFSTTSVVATLSTTSITPVGGTTSAVTGYENPTTESVVTGVSGTTTRYKTQSITPTNGTETVAIAAPRTSNFGIPRRPKIRIGSRIIFTTAPIS